MTVLNESTHTGEFLIAELPGLLSRKEAVLASGNNLEAGAVLGLVGGEYVVFAVRAVRDADIGQVTPQERDTLRKQMSAAQVRNK